MSNKIAVKIVIIYDHYSNDNALYMCMHVKKCRDIKE